jgi:hypothetical protein
MMRHCLGVLRNGQPCRAAPRVAGSFCFMHDPDRATEAKEARKLGGLRRRREIRLTGAFDVDGLDTVDGIRRLLEIAAIDGLGLDNSVARARILIAVAVAASRLIELGELEAGLRALEAVRTGSTRPAGVARSGESLLDDPDR